MNSRIAEVALRLPPTGDLAGDVDRLLAAHGRERTREHVLRVAAQARALAAHFGVDPDGAEVAALLHDVGVIFEWSEMPELCLSLGLRVGPEERQVPLLLHAKLSEVLARDFYGVRDTATLQAIRFHTTLHGAPTPLDEVVFLADKPGVGSGGHAALALSRRPDPRP